MANLDFENYWVNLFLNICHNNFTLELDENFSTLRLQFARLARKTSNLGLAEKLLFDEVLAWGYEPSGTQEMTTGNAMQALMNDVSAAKGNAKSVSVKFFTSFEPLSKRDNATWSLTLLDKNSVQQCFITRIYTFV